MNISSVLGIGSFIIAVLILGGLEDPRVKSEWWQWVIIIICIFVFGYFVYRNTMDKEEEEREVEEMRHHVNNLRRHR